MRRASYEKAALLGSIFICLHAADVGARAMIAIAGGSVCAIRDPPREWRVCLPETRAVSAALELLASDHGGAGKLMKFNAIA